MKKLLALLMALIIILAGCSVPAKEHAAKTFTVQDKSRPPFDFIPRDVKVVAVGDSLTEGIGDKNKRGGYIPYLKREIDEMKGVREATFYNFGVKGNRTDQLLERLKQKKVQREIEDADLVVITIGGNDIMKVFRDNFSDLDVDVFDKAQKDYADHLRDIIGTIRAIHPDVGIMLMGVYNPFMKWFSDVKEVDHIIEGWNRISEDVIEGYERTEFVPVADIFQGAEEELLYTDYFHPNNQGYKLIADRFFTHLQGENFSRLIGGE